MDISHRRIELQAPEDFSYLINNVRRAAADSINAAFPPVPDGHDDDHEDELRVRIEQMVDEYITKTFTYAAPNVSINGLPVDPSRFLPSNRNSSSTLKNGQMILEPEEQYEPFDARKRQRVEELAREEEDLLRSIASLKQRVPAATAQNWAKATKEAIVEDEKLLEVARDKVLGDLVAGPSSQEQQQQQESEMQIDGGDAEGQTAAGAGSSGGGKRKNNKKRRILLEDIGPLERQDSVEEEYRGAVEILGRLKRDMPATVAKMERARVAGGYVVTGR
ncbi:putative kinetochore protein [Rhypophila decipiens]